MLATMQRETTPDRLTELGRPLSTNEVEILALRMSEGLGLDLASLKQATGLDEQEIALRLSVLAMGEAEKRIERQQRRIDQLESLSITDELTGLLNRRGFRMELTRAIALAARGRERGLLVIVDLDGFKAVNDTHGHAAGDDMLVAIASMLRNAVRETDTVARLGGDEFAILMLDTNQHDVRDRLAAVEADINGRSFMWRGQALPIRASMGAVVLDGGLDAQTLVDRADAKMYAKKRMRADEANERGTNDGYADDAEAVRKETTRRPARLSLVTNGPAGNA